MFEKRPRQIIMVSLEPRNDGTLYAVKTTDPSDKDSCYVEHVAPLTDERDGWIILIWRGSRYRIGFTDSGQQMPNVRALRIGCRLTEIALSPENAIKQPGCQIIEQINV